MIIGKAWGITEPLLRSPLIEVHRLRILPRMRCSLHGHEFKWNLFLIMSGELTIEVKQKAYKLIDRTVLGPGAFTTVRPGLVHRFITGAKPVEAFEIYYPQWLEGEDIIRQDVGGVIRKRGRA